MTPAQASIHFLITKPRPGTGPGVSEQLVITAPGDGAHVCHFFVATGTVSPSGTRVTGQLLNSNGDVVANSSGTTNQNSWSCGFQIPANVAAGTPLQLVINTNPPGTGDSVNVVVGQC
jgi:hypothetical protein